MTQKRLNEIEREIEQIQTKYQTTNPSDIQDCIWFEWADKRLDMLIAELQRGLIDKRKHLRVVQ